MRRMSALTVGCQFLLMVVLHLLPRRRPRYRLRCAAAVVAGSPLLLLPHKLVSSSPPRAAFRHYGRQPSKDKGRGRAATRVVLKKNKKHTRRSFSSTPTVEERRTHEKHKKEPSDPRSHNIVSHPILPTQHPKRTLRWGTD